MLLLYQVVRRRLVALNLEVVPSTRPLGPPVQASTYIMLVDDPIMQELHAKWFSTFSLNLFQK